MKCTSLYMAQYFNWREINERARSWSLAGKNMAIHSDNTLTMYPISVRVEITITPPLLHVFINLVLPWTLFKLLSLIAFFISVYKHLTLWGLCIQFITKDTITWKFWALMHCMLTNSICWSYSRHLKHSVKKYGTVT